MKLPLYQVDAFTHQVFSGNPAAVCPLDSWVDEAVMQAIAAENNLAETAFFVQTEKGFDIRWFTPSVEVDLCGHATMASAHVLFEHMHYSQEKIVFSSRSGDLVVSKAGRGYEMNFPAQPCEAREQFDQAENAFGVRPIECHSDQDYLLVFENEDIVRELNPDLAALKTWDKRGVIVTARGDQTDFVNRFFAPNCGIDEDPVTGSAFTQLTPYWAKKLDKTTLSAKQISKRGGDVQVTLLGDRVLIRGECVSYLEGHIHI